MAEARTAMTLAGALVLAGCTSTAGSGSSLGHYPTDTCRTEPGQRFLGQRATAEIGAAIIAATRASYLRWLPPETIVTTEYAHGRITVSYDQAMQIERISCG